MKYNFTLLFLLIIFNFTTAQSIDATLVELNFHENSDPSHLTPFKSGFIFTATDGYSKKFGRELWYSDGTQQGTAMIKDIYPGGNSSNPNSLVTVNNVVFFTATDGFHGTELWKSDGTKSGTSMIKDIKPNNSDEHNAPSGLIALNGKLYFTASDNINGYELWTSDGTESGTYIVKDINPSGDSNANNTFVFNNNLYFIADDGTNGLQLWKSDGTESGTKMVYKNNSSFSTYQYGNQFLIMNNNFYFFANDKIKGYELWKSDGTESGTYIVKDIRNGANSSSYTLKGAVLNDMIIFEANDGNNGTEIWKSDGTESGTLMIRNINNTTSSSIPYDSKYIKFNNEIYFIADDGIHGNEIWKTDGTSNGTILLKDINKGESSAAIEKFHVDEINNKLLFYATNTNYSERKLWSSDGTPDGTLELGNTKASNSSGFPQSFVTVNNLTFLTGENDINGNELWSTNGTAAGTSIFADLNYSNSSSPSKFTNVNGNVFFRARGKEYGNQLFKSDGTISGTQLIKDINPGYDCMDDLSDMKTINGTLFFSANDGAHGYELWKSDGTEKGTVIIKDINPGNQSSMESHNDKQSFTVINNILYFSANDGVHGLELWRSDGTESGTYMIKDINVGYNGYPRSFTIINNIIYFISNDNTGINLWRTDGTQSGTNKVIISNAIRALSTVNNKLIIVADPSTSETSYGKQDLWVSDGTQAGTKLLKTFGGYTVSDIRITATLNNELYFVTISPNSSRNAIYKTDGTIKGTVLVFDGVTHPTMPDLKINFFLMCGNYLYFPVQKYYGSNDELWRTDGQITEKIAGSGADSFLYIRNLTCYNDNLLYLAELFPHKIWAVNNNLNEPFSLNINIINGKNFEENDGIQELGVTNNNNLYFNAHNDISGSELYIAKINGSSLGTSDYYNSKDSDLKQVTIYPNPANEYITIKSINQSEIVKFDLWDLTGKKIDEQLNKNSKREIKYDVSKLNTGIYFIKVTLSNGKTNDLKLIVN